MTKRTIGGLIREALKEGKDTAAILALVRAEFPGAQTSSASVAWYRSQMKKEADKGETAPPVKLVIDHGGIDWDKEPVTIDRTEAKDPLEGLTKYRVGKYKATQGMEGPGFVVTLYLGPQAVAEAADYGDGGPVHWTWFDKRPCMVKTTNYKDEPHEYKGVFDEALFAAHCMALPKYKNPWDEDGGEHFVTPDILVEELVNDMQLAKQLARLTRGKIAYFDPEGKLWTLKRAPTPESIAQFKGVTTGAQVLNGMPEAEAIALLKKYQH
jgi:hypothetical protein